MQVQTRAIVLSSIKYGDTSLIVRAFTASDGLKAYMLKGILSSRKGRLRPALFLPLMQLDLQAVHKNKGGLERIREARISYPYQSLHTEIVKNSIALFLAEMLGSSIREEEQNPALYHFLEASLQWLDTHENTANFHLFFLLELTKYLGFYPDTSDLEPQYFDLQEGEFVSQPGLNPVIQGDNLGYFKALLGTNFDGIHTIRMDKKAMQELLQSLVLYFEVHLHGFKKPRSLAVLNEVFN